MKKKEVKKKKDIKKEKILLIDVSNLLYRMYYVHQYLTNKNGLKTGAIYGFLKMLIFYAEKTGIKNIVLAWDSNESGNWRNEIYPEYKASRINKGNDPSKIDLMNVITYSKSIIFNICLDCGFLNIIKPGYEADDMIGAFIKKFPRRIKILSMDKDLLQFVDDTKKIRLYRPDVNHKDKNNKSYNIYNEQRVFDEYGVYPKHFHHLLAIAGDDCDGIPGVGGYAYKKASKLFNETQGKVEKALSEDKYKIYERNLTLVNLHSLPIKLTKDCVIVRKEIGDKELKRAQKVLEEMQIKSYTAKDLFNINNSKFKFNIFSDLVEEEEEDNDE